MGFLQNAIPALCAAGLLSTAAANLNNVDSVARCSIQLSSGGTSDSLSATAIAAATATADLLCNGTSVDVNASAFAQAEAIAFAAAEAVALVSVDCYSSGNSRFTVDGLSIAQARAEAYAEAYVSATASASVCSPNFNCTAVASFVGSAFQAIFAEAVARAEVTLDQDSPDTSVTAFSQNVTNVTASVWAVALADAQASVADGCDLDLVGLGAAGDSGIFCAVELATEDNSTVEDATVEVAVDAVAVSGCNGSAQNITAEDGEALASAIASVIAEISAFCDTTGNGSICVTGEANVSAAAEATAAAFARAFLNASSTCENTLCETSVEVVTEAVTSVSAEAAARLLVEECADGGGTINVNEFASDFVANTSSAFASIIANATVVGGVCFIDVNITAATTIIPPVVPMMPPPPPPPPMMMSPPPPPPPPPMMMPPPPPPPPVMPPPPPPPPMMDNDTIVCPNGTECVRNNRQCAGEDFEFARPCCSDNYLCVRRNNLFSQCRLNGVPGLVSWEGSILPCGAPSDISADDLPAP